MPYISTPSEDFGFIRVVPESMAIRLEPIDDTPEIFATVMPTRTDSEICNAVVDWENTPMISTLVQVDEAGIDPWRQRLKLVLATLSMKSTPSLQALRAGHWRAISLSMQDQARQSQDGSVHFSVDARTWVAQLGSNRAGDSIQLPVPEALRDKDAGTVLVQMCLQLLTLHRPV